MAVRKGFLLRALLKRNYLPMQKKRKEELPPVFVSSDLTKDIAEQLSNIALSRQRKNDGFDSVRYFTTRYNNVPRLLSIPHPRPYCELCLEIYRNWSRIERICTNINSLVRPREHRDKRTIIMDYENAVEKRKRCNKQAFGKKYVVHTDIANFYPGFYSHVIPWALVGVGRAKKERNNSSRWFNKIDKSVRTCCRCETAGVPIGPATSNIVCEIVLERIDRVLRKRFSYVRFIDDYTAYCETETRADEFIRELSRRLLKYKLNLSISKTRIDRLPQTIDEDWVNRVREIVPQGTNVNPSQVSNILETALVLQKDNPDGSVLKYAINSIVERLNDESSLELVKYAIKLCLHYPVLIPTLRTPLETIYRNNSENFEAELLFLLKDSVRYRRSDTTCWLLYYLKVFHGDIPTNISERIVEWGDCMALALLAEYPTHQREVAKFVRKLDKTDLHGLDSYWLLLYQLYLKGKIRNPYSNDDTFKILKKHDVSFIRF